MAKSHKSGFIQHTLPKTLNMKKFQAEWVVCAEKVRVAFEKISEAVARWVLRQGDTPQRRQYLANLELEAALERRLLEAQKANKPRDSHGRYTKRSAPHRA